MIQITNHGPLILASSYWSSEIEAAGKLLVSPNAGAIRVLLPRSQRPVINELRAAASQPASTSGVGRGGSAWAMRGST